MSTSPDDRIVTQRSSSLDSVFTGLVREVGRVASISGVSDGTARLRIESQLEAAIGDSVSINGCCLTVVDGDRSTLAFDAVPETLARTTLQRLKPGAHVNVEPALRAGEALGGHYVQGHVDGVGSVRSVEPEGDGKRVWFDAPESVLRYCVEKGSVAVDGVSLTVAGLDDDGFAVALVPHTLAVTTLGSLEPGREANLEVDVLAKYVERLTGLRSEHGDDG
jgi:riboflavin synthase